MNLLPGSAEYAPAENLLPKGESGALVRPALVGLAVGVLVAALPHGVWWVPQATVYALIVAVIAAIYIGFAVADGRPGVIVVESVVAVLFMLLASLGVAGSPWLLVIGLLGHGVKDLVQHRTGFVRGMRWWPPFCVAVDWLAGAILAVALLAG